MHEFALAQDIISSLETKFKDDLKTITSIDIEAGVFSGIVTDSLAFGLETLFLEKQVKDVEINIGMTEAKAICECGNIYNPKAVFELCPKCGSTVRTFEKGTDVLVKSVNLREVKQ